MGHKDNIEKVATPDPTSLTFGEYGKLLWDGGITNAASGMTTSALSQDGLMPAGLIGTLAGWNARSGIANVTNEVINVLGIPNDYVNNQMRRTREAGRRMLRDRGASLAATKRAAKRYADSEFEKTTILGSMGEAWNNSGLVTKGLVTAGVASGLGALGYGIYKYLELDPDEEEKDLPASGEKEAGILSDAKFGFLLSKNMPSPEALKVASVEAAEWSGRMKKIAGGTAIAALLGYGYHKYQQSQHMPKGGSENKSIEDSTEKEASEFTFNQRMMLDNLSYPGLSRHKTFREISEIILTLGSAAGLAYGASKIFGDYGEKKTKEEPKTKEELKKQKEYL